MLLVVKNLTFPPFGVIVRIVNLTNKIANNTTHSLKQYKIGFLSSFSTKKCKGREKL
jgi:hypothetical protein